MNDKRARNRMATAQPRPGGGMRSPRPPAAGPDLWERETARHCALRDRRRMLARLDAAGWPQALVRRLLPLYPARPVDPAWAAQRDAWVRHVYGLELLRRQAEHRLPPAARRSPDAPPPPSGLNVGVGPGGMLRRLAKRHAAALMAPLALVWLLVSAVPAHAAESFVPPSNKVVADCYDKNLAKRWGATALLGAVGAMSLMGGEAVAAKPQYEQPGRTKIELSTPVLDGLYQRRVLAENENPRIGAGVVGDANFDGQFNIADPVYLLSSAEPFNINGFAPDGHFIVGDTTPTWGLPVVGQTTKMSSEASVLNMNDVDIIFRYCVGRENGMEGILRNPVIRAKTQRTLHSLVENALGVSGEVDPRVGNAYYDIRLLDGSEPSVDQLSRVFVTASLTADDSTMIMMPVKAGEFQVVGASSIVPLPADVENQEATLVLPNPHPDPAMTRVKLRGPSGPALGTKDYTIPGFGVLRAEPFADLGVALENGCYIEAYTYAGARDIVPSIILFEKNSGSITHVPSKKVFEGTTRIIIPFVANKSLTIGDKEYTLETDTFVNNYGQENGAQIVYGFYEDGIDHYPTPGLIQGDILAIGEQKSLTNVLHYLWGASDKLGYLNEGGAVGGKLKWGLTRMIGPDGKTTLTSTPAVTSANDATGNTEQYIPGLERNAEKKTGVRLLQTSIPSDGTATLGIYANGSLLGYKTLTTQSLTATTIDDIFAEYLGPDAVVKNGAVRVIANSGSFQAFGQTWNNGSMLWTPGQTYDHGENTRPEIGCIEDVWRPGRVYCQNNYSITIWATARGPPPEFGSEHFRFQVSDADGDPLVLNLRQVNGDPLPSFMTQQGFDLYIDPDSSHIGQKYYLMSSCIDGKDQSYDIQVVVNISQ